MTTTLAATRLAARTRSPADWVRLVVSVVALALTVGAATFASSTFAGVQADLLRAVARIPGSFTRFVLSVLQVVALLVPFTVIVWLLIHKRVRLAIVVLVTNAAASTAARLVATNVSDLQSTLEEAGLVDVFDTWINATSFPDMAYLAGGAATATVLGPWLGRAWRRALWTVITFAAFIRLITGTDVPIDVLTGISIGWAVGALAVVLTGSPNREPAATAISATLGLHGIAVRRLDKGDGQAWTATTDRGPLYIDALGADQRTADLLYRLYRRVRLQDPGDEAPFSTLRRQTEHEALLTLAAARVGVRTPEVVLVAPINDDSDQGMVIAHDLVDGVPLDRLGEGRCTDDVLRAIWQQVALLRRAGIAHRRLDARHVLVDALDRPYLVGFDAAELAATGTQLAGDVAELLVVTATLVGEERAVAAAVDTLGTAPVIAAIPRLQPLALGRRTRRLLRQAQSGLLDRLRAQATAATDQESVELARLERVSPRTVVSIAMVAVALYVLVPQLADVAGLWSAAQSASWWWAVPAVAASAVTFVGAAMGVAGSVPDRLQPGPLLAVQLASAFANRVSPAGVGGMAVNGRYLQRAGVDPAVAATGVGLNAVAGVAVHFSLIVVFAVLVGSGGLGSLPLPSGRTVALSAAVVAAVVVVGVAVPASRRILRRTVLPAARRGVQGVGAVARRPAKLGLLLGGSAVLTLANAACLVFAVQAFGGGLTTATVVTVYLAGAAVASVAPTPGGLGATEAALLAGLTSVGLPGSEALPAVMLMRLVSFWMPIPPGWFVFQHLTRRGEL